MKQSFAIPYSHSTLFLPKRVRHILQIPRNTVLSCRVIDDAASPSLIVSTLPFGCWASTHRVVINTHHSVGAFQEILGVLRDLDLNILHMWASAASTEGELTLTAMVSPLSTEMPQPEELRKRIVSLVQDRERAQSRELLSSSRLYRESNLDHCRVTPMKVLRALATLPPLKGGALQSLIRNRIAQEAQIQLREGRMDIAGTLLHSADPGGEAASLADVLRIPGRRHSSSVLVTPDTEEWYLRVSLMPDTRFYTVRLPIQVEASSEQGLIGASQDLVSALVQSTEMNIYYAQSILHGKSSGGGIHREESELTVSGSRESIVQRSIQEAILGPMQDRLAAVAKNRQTLDPGSSYLIDAARCSVTPMLAPFVFLATNAKVDTPEYLDVAIELCRLLKDMHFRPVFLDRANSTLGATMAEEMTRILDCSPLLVSLHLPEQATRLKNERSGIAYSPSAWTMFEEAYLRAKGGRGMFRLIHEEVFPPPFLEGQQAWRFHSPEALKDIFPRLRVSLDKFRQDADWPDLVVRCQSVMLESGLGNELIARDPEQFFLEEKTKMVLP